MPPEHGTPFLLGATSSSRVRMAWSFHEAQEDHSDQGRNLQSSLLRVHLCEANPCDWMLAPEHGVPHALFGTSKVRWRN